VQGCVHGGRILLYDLIGQPIPGLWLPIWRSSRQILQIQHCYGWDAHVSGRPRPEDLQFWVREERAVPLWFRRQGQTVGYGYVRFGAETLPDPQSCTLGPMGADTPEDATACVLAAVHWAMQRAVEVHTDVPGPHPCLITLLERGFHIHSFDTFVSSADTPFFDARCYIASGGDLF